MHIHRLRQKIDDGFECRLIHAVAGPANRFAKLSRPRRLLVGYARKPDFMMRLTLVQLPTRDCPHAPSSRRRT